MASQGILLPISLLISNLLDVAQQLKLFAGKNILGDSLGGKKVESELNNILRALGQIETRAKNAFKTNADFTGLEKDINKIELSLEHVLTTVRGLTFKDMKIPGDVLLEITDLTKRMLELKNGFATFKASLKEKLLANTDFTAGLSSAFGGSAAKMLTKNYDEMYNAIKNGMEKVNAELIVLKAEFERNSLIVTQNTTGKANFTAWGALDFVSKAFEQLPKDRSKWSELLLMLSKYMNFDEEKGQFTTFNSRLGGKGAEGFWRELASRFTISNELLEEIRKRVTASVEKGKKTAADVLREAATDLKKGTEIFAGKGIDYASLLASKEEYSALLKEAANSKVSFDGIDAKAKAAALAWKELSQVQSQVANELQVLEAALLGPQAALDGMEESLRNAIMSSPEFAQAFSAASSSIQLLLAAADEGRAKLATLDQTVSKLSGILNFINRYIGMYAIIRKVTLAVRNAFNNIKELDKSITSIAVVTNMSLKDLWGKIGEYTSMAQEYGVATKDVYTVSQIFYQLGLLTAQVMSLTTETLKMAKIAGMDYSTAANAMTVAIRAFNIEMSEAQSVTDTYSALAAKFAVSSAEIANAMEKTASSAASVGMSLQSTSAFISVMEQTTRESAQNIGSALKSIISRYGEMKASPDKLLNVDGEEVAFNKVDTALKSIGISIKDSAGQFRDFDDVIMELASKWNTLDNNTQRYIATIMAGNRQQSRFIALVSNYDELSRAMDVANNAENASIVLVAKTMDSLESKTQLVKNAFSLLYLDLHIEDGLKGAYDWLTRILKTIGKLGTLKGALPTLMNVIGAGTGAKSLVGMYKEHLITKKGLILKRIDLDDADAKKKALELQLELEKTALKHVEIITDSNTQNPEIIANNMSVLMNNTGVLLAMTPGLIGFLTRSNSNISPEEALNRLYSALASGLLKTEAGLREFLTNNNVPEQAWEGENGALAALLGLATAAQNATTGISLLGNDALSAGVNMQQGGQDAKEGGENAKEGGLEAKEGCEAIKDASLQVQTGALNVEAGELKLADSAEGASITIRSTEASFTRAGGSADDLSNSLEVPTPQLENLGLKTEQVGNEILSSGQKAGSGLLDVANTAPQAAQVLRLQGDGGGKTPPLGNTGAGGGKAATAIRIGASAARLIGTAIVAQGASHEDKSDDTLFGRGAEKSKVYTGLGNGLSMAGTFASIGMITRSPLIAGLAGLAGFLVGGIGSIIDGLTMTLKEKLALQKEEAKKASDEALKASAKSTDLENQLDNLKQLKKHMYDSTDAMLAYKDAMNTLGQQYPNLISAYDELGNAIIELLSAEMALVAARKNAAVEARKAAVANAEATNTLLEIAVLFKDKILELNDKLESSHYKSDFWGASVTTTNGWEVIGPDGQPIAILGRESIHTNTETGSSTTDYLTVIEKTLQATAGASFVFDESFVADAERRGRLNNLLERLRNGKLDLWSYLDVEDWSWWLSLREATWKGFTMSGLSAIYAPTSGVRYETTLGTLAEYNALMNMPKYYELLVEGNGEMEFAGAIEVLDDFVSTNKEILGTSATTAAEYFGWKGDTPTRSDIRDALKVMNGTIALLLNTLKNLAQLTGKAYATEYFINDIEARDDISSSTKARLTNSDTYSNLLYYGLENKAIELGFGSSAEWATKNKATYRTQAVLMADEVADFLANMTESELELFETATADMTIYRSSDELLDKLGIDKESFVGLALIKEFVEANLANKNRILKTIYANPKGSLKTLNTNLTGLKKFSTYEQYGPNNSITIESNKALDITLLLDSGQIISKYADYFTSLLVDINKLAEDGYTELASRRLNVLHSFAQNISSFSSQDLANLFGLMTGVDFTDYNSIKEARKEIENYGAEHGIDVSGALKTLDDAADSLVFNVSSLSNALTTLVLSAAKAIDALISSAKSGFTLDKAIEELDKINARSKDKLFNFDEIYRYDAALGKYVLTELGLMTSMLLEESDLEDRANKLRITSNKHTAVSHYISHQKIASNQTFDTAKQMQEFVKGLNGWYTPEYEALINDFMKDDTIANHSWEEFVKYVAKRAGEDSEEAKRALQQYEAYMDNKKNLLYSQIDWGKLALGTDSTGTNKTLMMLLAGELDLATYNQDTKMWEWVNNQEKTWDQIQDIYLDKLYGTDEAAKAAAKTAIKGQQNKSVSDQVSTAINEVLAGAGLVVSDTTAALLQKDNLTNLVDAGKGVIEAEQDYVTAALKLYEDHKKLLLSIADQNTAFSAILTKQFENANQVITTLTSGASLDINALSQTFTTFGLEMGKYYNAQDRLWEGDFKGALETDIFGKTRIKDWDKFIQGLGTKVDISQYTGTFEYKNAYSSYVDGLITLDTLEQDLIKKNYDNAFSSITAWKPVNVSMIKNDAKLKELIEASGSATLDEYGRLVVNDAVQYAKDISKYLIELTTMPEADLYKQSGLTRADLAKDWKNAQTVITSVQDAWTGISENISALTTDQIANLVEKGNFNLKALDLGALFTKIGDVYSLNLEAYRQYLIKEIGGVEEYDQIEDPALRAKIDEAYNKAALAIVNKITGLDWTKILDGTATTADLDAFRSGLGEALASLGTDIAGFYSEDGKFDYQGLIADLRKQVELGDLDAEIAELIINNIVNTVANVRDTALEEISTGMNLLSSGTTSLAEIAKFVLRYNKLTGENKSIDDLFNYNELTLTYTLTQEALILYYEKLKKLLNDVGMTDAAIALYIKDLALLTIGAEMDISGFLSSTDISSNGKAAQMLMSQIKNWYAVLGAKITDTTLNTIMLLIINGGDEAVKKLKEFKGESNVSSDEIQAVYKAQINRLNDALDQVSNGLEKGAIITGELATLLQKIGYSESLRALGDGTYVVDAVIDMVDAYAAIYAKMKSTTEATLSELNSAYAKLLTATEQGNIDAISALGDAMGMDYETFGALLAQYGKYGWKSLEFTMAHQYEAGIELLGNGTIKIVDFSKFARHMNWEVGGEEYVKALDAYNDSLLSDMTEESESVVEEIKTLTTARKGLKINFTRILAALNLTDQAFNELFGKYGVEIKNGILEIIDTSHLPELTRDITMQAASAANLIPEQIAEIKDAVVETLSTIAELINKGIKGTLSNVEALDLQKWGIEHGFVDANGKSTLTFTETVDGLKLSEKAAIALYAKLKDIDSIRAQLVFDELNESLAKTNEHYKTISSIMDRIAWIESQDHPERKLQYAEELALAKDILAVRSTTEDSSFDFMNNEIPAAQNNPIKYFESWGKAWSTLRDSFKAKGKDRAKIEYQDFYNMMTEMGHIAEVSGVPIKLGANKFVTDAKSALELIEQGAACLSVASDGSVKVDLSKFGLDFAGGADEMSKNVDEGIRAIAKSLIEMIDSMILLLEVVVAMEQLGNIDVNGDNAINLDEIFVIQGDGSIKGADGLIHFKKEYSDVAQTILDMAKTDKDLDAALNSVRINNYTMKQILEDATDGVLDLEIDAEAYKDAINAFYQMAMSGDYDLDDLFGSLRKIMDASGLKNITVDVGEKTFQIVGGNKFVFDWSDEKATKAAEEAITEQGEAFIKKWNLGGKTSIKDKLLALASKLEDPDLSIEDKAELLYVLLVGTGAITIEPIKEGPNKYEGTYKGLKIKRKTKKDCEDAIKTAIRYEEEGFTFKFTDDGKVVGLTKIGGALIEVTEENGKKTYKTKWGEFGTKDEAIKDCVNHGYADASMDGYTFDGGNLEVKYNETLGIGFVFNHGTGEYWYDGKPFASPEAMYDYIHAVSAIPADKWTTTTSKNKKGLLLEVKTYGTAKITHNLKTGETIYEADGITFNSPKAYAEWLAAKQLAEGLGTGEVIEARNGHKQLNFKLSGKEVTLDINSRGLTRYSFLIGGKEFTSDTEAGIKQAIADHDWLSDSNALIEGDESVSYKITENGSTLTVTYKGDEVTVVDETGKHDTELEEKLSKKLQSQVDETQPKAEAKNAEVTIGEGSQVKLAEGEEGKVPEFPIDSITIKPTQVNVSIGTGVTPKFTNGENATSEMSIDKITLKPSSIEVDATGKATIAEGTTVSLKDKVAVIGDASGLSVSLKEDSNVSLVNKSEDGQIDLDYIGTAKGTVDGIEVSLNSAAINTLAENETVKINDAFVAIGDASKLEVTLGDGTTKTLATQEEDGVTVESIDKVKASAGSFEITLDELTPKELAENSVVSLTSEVSALATASLLLVSIESGATNVDIDANSMEGPYDIGTIENATATITNLTVGNADNITTPEDINGNATITATVDDLATDTLNSIKDLADDVDVSDPNIDVEVDKSVDTAATMLKNLINLLNVVDAKDPVISVYDNVTSKILSIQDAINSLHGKTVNILVNANVPKAIGNLGAEATGNAMASGNTLMGELGPELVVLKGRYFVAGQNGAEFVDLAPDAIVFNHLLTLLLLKNGMSNERGRAVTNERVATAFAQGNVHGGPAMASASAALSALKQLKAMWEALLDASVKDLAGKGGGGGGGGGKDPKVQSAWIAQVERWYNLMLKIALCEKDITHEQTLRTKLASDINKNGKAYYQSQVREMQALLEELVAQEALNISRQDYFDQRREQLNTDKNNPFNLLYEFDENGQLKYKDDYKGKGADGKTKTGGFEFLSDLMSLDERSKAKYTAEEQYNALKKAGFGDYMQYKSNGEKIEKDKDGNFDYAAAVEAFWENVESQKEEMLSLHDAIEDGNNKTLELLQKLNEILQEIRDNLMDLEEKVLNAIESLRLRAIDNLSEERDALEQSTSKYIEGLSEALSKEKNLYDLNLSSEELNKMRRLLAILLRSGGSGSEIRGLQSLIQLKELDTYFEDLQRQIDAILEASDKEIERLDALINLMTETLEYLKAMGLLWGEVYLVMAMSPTEIASFIYLNDQALWSESPLKNSESMLNLLFSSQQWGEFRDSTNSFFSTEADATKHQGATILNAVYGGDALNWATFDTAMAKVYGEKWNKIAADQQGAFRLNMAQTGDITDARQKINEKLGELKTALTSAISSFSGGSSGGSSSRGGSGSGSSSGGTTRPSSRRPSGRSNPAGDALTDIGNAIGNAINEVTKRKTVITKPALGRLRTNAAGGYVKEFTISSLAENGEEAVLNARLTKILRDNILSNKPNSLISLLDTYNSAYKDGISTINNEGSVVIENAVVNMNVSQIANDYDAQRAGEQALDEMLKIARKTYAKNSIRR